MEALAARTMTTMMMAGENLQIWVGRVPEDPLLIVVMLGVVPPPAQMTPRIPIYGFMTNLDNCTDGGSITSDAGCDPAAGSLPYP